MALTLNGLDNLLKKHYTVDVMVREIHLTPHHKDSCCKLTAVIEKVTGREELVIFFAKIYKQDPNVKIRVDRLTRFKKEVDFYQIAIPAVTEFQLDNGISIRPYRNIFAKCIGARISIDPARYVPDETGVLILENLNVGGYVSGNAKQGFDTDSCKLVLSKLAEMHVAPIAMRTLCRDMFKEKVLRCLLDVKPQDLRPSCFQNVKKLIETLVQFDHTICPYITSIVDAIENCKQKTWFGKSYTDETWTTLCHSNFSILNLAIQYDLGGKPICCKVMDLERLEYSHCCTDVLYFLFTSVDNSDLRYNFDYFTTWYFECFVDRLREYEIDISPYTLKKFREQINIEGPKLVFKILRILPKIACTEYDREGKPVLGIQFKQKLRDTMVMMISRGWINT